MASTRKKPQDPEVIFTRGTRRVPMAVRQAADLWLDMFMGISDTIAPDRKDGESSVNSPSGRAWLGVAAELADHALELYESRWPHTGHGER